MIDDVLKDLAKEIDSTADKLKKELEEAGAKVTVK